MRSHFRETHVNNQFLLRTVLRVGREDSVGYPIESLSTQEASDRSTSIVDWNGKANSLSSCADCHVNTNHFSQGIQQRSTAVARIDAGVCLDEIFIRLSLINFDVSTQCADDSSGYRVPFDLVNDIQLDFIDRFAIGNDVDGKSVGALGLKLDRCQSQIVGQIDSFFVYVKVLRFSWPTTKYLRA